jgi:hypothetical protein
LSLTYSYYIYVDDSGTSFQIYLNDILASLAGFSLASGSELHLPPGISPRFALLEAEVGGVIQRLAIAFPTIASLVSVVAQSYVIGTTTYRCIGAFSESAGYNPFVGIFGNTGPRGEDGTPGSFSHNRYFAPVTQVYTPTSGPRVFDINIPEPGLYLALGTLVMNVGTQTGLNQIMTHQVSGAGYWDYTQHFIPAQTSGMACFQWHEILSFTSPPSEVYWGMALTDSVTIYGGEFLSGGAYSCLDVFKLG